VLEAVYDVYDAGASSGAGPRAGAAAPEAPWVPLQDYLRALVFAQRSHHAAHHHTAGALEHRALAQRRRVEAQRLFGLVGLARPPERREHAALGVTRGGLCLGACGLVGGPARGDVQRGGLGRHQHRDTE
jgi:hypothetical protein